MIKDSQKLNVRSWLAAEGLVLIPTGFALHQTDQKWLKVVTRYVPQNEIELTVTFTTKPTKIIARIHSDSRSL